MVLQMGNLRGVAACGWGAARRCFAAAPDALPDCLEQVLDSQLDVMRSANTYKVERVITSPQATSIGVGQGAGQKEVLNFCANNYLGLSNHPAVVHAAHHALQSHGFGMSSVRFICGTQDLHKQLEARISAFHGTQDCILYPSCFDANAGLFEALLGPEDAVISDALNHASIIDGIRLCKAQRYRYQHMDMEDLEAKLQEADSKGARIKLIATDGVFSMDGDVAPLDQIVALARKYGAYTFVDDCHATGFLGPSGRGTDEACGVQGQVDIINSTLGKALGGACGGYTTASRKVVDLLRQKSRPYLFSNTLAPVVVGASLAVFELLSQGSALRDSLAANTRHFRERMGQAGFQLRPGYHPIVPIMLGEARLASDMAAQLLDHGIFVTGFSYPVVPKGAARIRVQISAAHSTAQIDKCVDAFVAVGKQLGVLA
ncbi:mitochondrial 2-amino-3-ketobutyrate coenzyme A ligase [Haematococcus lacustris]